MAWGMVIGGLISAYAANQSNKKNAEAAKNSGHVNLLQQTTPWGPDEQYRNWIMDAGADVLGMPRNQGGRYASPYTPQGGSTTGSSWPGVTPQTMDPAFSNRPKKPITGGPGGGGQTGEPIQYAANAKVPAPPPVPAGGSARPDGRIVDAKGKTVYTPPKQGAKAPKGGAKTPTGGAASANVTTQQIMKGMLDDVQAPNRTEDAAVDYTNAVLRGEETNRYRGEAADAVRGASKNANLDRFIADLWAGKAPGSGMDSGGNPAGSVGRGGRGSSSGFTRDASGSLIRPAAQPAAPAVQQDELVGVRDDIRAVLDGQGIPKEYREMLERQALEARQRNARDVNALFVGANMQGSSPWQTAFAEGQSDAEQGFSDQLIRANFDLYGNAMNLGTGYDVSALDRSSRERMSAADRAAAAAAQERGLSASARANDASLQQQRELAQMGMLQNAIGMEQQGQQFGAQGLSGLSGLYSGDQQQALSMVPELSNLNTGAWAALGGIGAQSDATAASIKNANTSANAQRGIANAQLQWERDRLNQMQNWEERQYYDPLNRLGGFMGLVNGASSGYGTIATNGIDQRNAAPPAYSSPWLQGAAGAMAGRQFAQSYKD